MSSRKTLVRRNGEKLALPIANRSSSGGWKNRADLPRRKGGEQILEADLRRLLARRNGRTDLRLAVARSPPGPPADTNRLPPQGNYERWPEPVPLEKVSDKKPRLNANARRPGP